MMERKIVTSHVYPPIPARNWDWCAHYDGEEEAGNYGWGRTEAEAIQDFRDYCADAHDARLAKAEAMQRWGDMHDMRADLRRDPRLFRARRAPLISTEEDL
jgi:hypothetical protein